MESIEPATATGNQNATTAPIFNDLRFLLEVHGMAEETPLKIAALVEFALGFYGTPIYFHRRR